MGSDVLHVHNTTPCDAIFELELCDRGLMSSTRTTRENTPLHTIRFVSSSEIRYNYSTASIHRGMVSCVTYGTIHLAWAQQVGGGREIDGDSWRLYYFWS